MPTDYFVITGGSDAAAGTSFDAGFETVKKGMDTIVAGATGDRLFIDDGVREVYSTSGDVSWTAGSLTAPAYVVSVDSTSSATSGTNGDLFTYSPMPQTLTSTLYDFGFIHTAAVGNGEVRLSGNWVIRGVNFMSQNDYMICAYTAASSTVMEDCSVGSLYNIAGSLTPLQDDGCSVVWRNVSPYCSGADAGLRVRGGGTLLAYDGGTHASWGSTASLFAIADLEGATVEFHDFDASSITVTDIMGSSASYTYIDALFDGCLFPTGATFNDFTAASSEWRVALNACAFGSDDTIGQRLEHYEYGDVTDNTTTYGVGTFDGSTGFSLLMSPSTSTREGVRPLRIKLGEMYLDTTSAQFKITCASQLDDSQFWIEVHAPDATYLGLGNILSSKGTVLSPTTIPADMDDVWTAPKTYEQKIMITFTAGEQAGNCTVYACAAIEAGNVDIYVDPEPREA